MVHVKLLEMLENVFANLDGQELIVTNKFTLASENLKLTVKYVVDMVLAQLKINVHVQLDMKEINAKTRKNVMEKNILIQMFVVEALKELV